MCGRMSSYIRSIAASWRRSYVDLCGTRTSRAPCRLNFSTTVEPRNPSPPVTTTRRSFQKSDIGCSCSNCFPPVAGRLTASTPPYDRYSQVFDDVESGYGARQDLHERRDQLNVVRVYRGVAHRHEHLRAWSRLRRAGEDQRFAPRADLTVGVLHVHAAL